MATMGKTYLEIVPLSNTGSKTSAFTYYSQEPLSIGTLVKITLGRRQVFGVVTAAVNKPNFTTKPVAATSTLPPIPEHIIELARWMSDYYTTPLSQVLHSMLPSTPFLKRDTDLNRALKTSKLPASNSQSPKLHTQQAGVLKQIAGSDQHAFLLHGVTGSGKTQVYIELSAQAAERGNSSIILVPEISLTPQLAEQFQKRFGSQVAITHSGLTDRERRQIWQQCLVSTHPIIAIGPRSALFLPVRNLGFIAIDEAHETSYKQEQSPRYHATLVAAKLSKIAGAKLLLGSATPSVNDYYLAKQGKLQLLKMPERIHKTTLAKPTIVDLRDKSLLSSSRLFSKPLLSVLKTTMEQKRQSIIFINRRGSATSVVCANCGWVATSEHTGIPLTWHADEGALRDHVSGEKSALPANCPECGHLQLRFLGFGTKRVEAELQKLLPNARINRLDKDSFDAKTINQVYSDLKTGKIDILVGTQMIAKGLDLPNVDTVGVVLADTMMYLPDFSSSERTFQLLWQVAGRAGRRSNSKNNVVIQTYSPEHPIIKAVVGRDYEEFAKNELAERKLLKYPPFVYLLKLTCARASRQSAQKAADSLASDLVKVGKIEISGPAPAWREKLGPKYHWQIIVKSRQRSQLVEIANSLPSGWTHDLDPMDLL